VPPLDTGKPAGNVETANIYVLMIRATKNRMRKYIEIDMEALERLVEGKRVEGALRRDEWTGRLSFRAYKRRPIIRNRDRIIRKLEHGWIKESKERIKLYETIPKDLGTARIMAVIDRETKEAKGALIDRELDLMEFC
jgi:hypothetical protein